MFWTIIAILVALWLVGLVGLVADVAGGLIHLLLVVAAIVIAFRFLSGRSVA